MLSGTDRRRARPHNMTGMTEKRLEGDRENHPPVSITSTSPQILPPKKMNPRQYSQSPGMFYSPVSSHYAQAYLQNSLPGFQRQTPASQPASNPFGSQQRPRPKGAHRCTYDQCTFSGSQKAVEVHMMDRHLIYPPTCSNEQRNWDADPSLKGHVLPVSHATLNQSNQPLLHIGVF